MTIEQFCNKYIVSGNKKPPQDIPKPTFRGIKQKIEGELKGIGGNFYVNHETCYDFIVNGINGTSLLLGEVKTEYYKFIVDIDLKPEHRIYDDKSYTFGENLYDKFAKDVINCIEQSVRYYIKNTDNLDYIVCNKKKMNNKIHIYFPDLIVNNDVSQCIRKHALESIIKLDYHLKPEQWNEIYDASVSGHNGLRPLFVKKIGEKKGYEIDFKLSSYGGISKDKIEQLKLTRIATDATKCNFQPNGDLLEKDMIKYKIIKPKNDNKFKDNEDVKAPKKSIETETKPATEEELKEYKTFLDLINRSRWSNRDSWIKLLIACKNSGISRELFNEYSKKNAPDKYDEDGNNTTWDSIHEEDRESKLTFASIKYWAKEDNPEEYKKIASHYKDLFTNGISDVIAAELFYNIYGDKYMFIPLETKGEWYYINEFGIYCKDKGNKKLFDDINELKPKYIKPHYLKLLQNTKETELEKSLNKKYGFISSYLDKHRTKEAIKGELELKYADPEAFEKMDNVNHDIFAFNNGVYDLKTLEFRNAKSEEFISSTCGYNYIENVDKDVMKHLNKVLSDILPDKEDLKFFLKSVGQQLLHKNTQQRLLILYGNGANGKSILMRLIGLMFGNLYKEVDVAYLAQKNGAVSHSSNGTEADAILSQSKNIHIMATSEPERDMTLKEAKIKKFVSGTDQHEARKLFQNDTIKFKSRFLLMIQTNENLSFSGMDFAMTRRMVKIIFPNRFVEKPTKPNERLMDTELSEKIEENENYKLAFFKLLLEAFKEHKASGEQKIKLSPNIQQATNDYVKDNSSVALFAEGLEYTGDDKNDRLTAKDLLILYKESYDLILTITKFSELLEIALTEKTKRAIKFTRPQNVLTLKGFRIKEEKEEENKVIEKKMIPKEEINEEPKAEPKKINKQEDLNLFSSIKI